MIELGVAWMVENAAKLEMSESAALERIMNIPIKEL